MLFIFEQNEFDRGWNYFVALAGAKIAYEAGDKRIQEVLNAIKILEDNINKHPNKNNSIATFQGFVAEEWSAGTFNVNAAAAGSKDRAFALKLNTEGSVDVELNSGKKYSMKSYADGPKSAKAQANSKYSGQERWVPEDFLDSAKEEAHRQMLRNKEIRPDVSDVYGETEHKLTDRIVNDEGIESNPVFRKKLDKMAKAGQKGEFKAEDYDVTVKNAMELKFIVQEALKAGYTAAALTFAFQMAPELYKCIDYLIKSGEIEFEQVLRLGEKAITSSAEGFLCGSIACALTLMAEEGDFGKVLAKVSGNWIGMTTSILLATLKDSIYFATGRISARELGASLIDRAAIGVGYTVVGAQVVDTLLSTQVIKKISAAIGQLIGFEFPVMGYLIGSLVGSAIATVYNVGKRKFLSICVDTGFACFGLVDQNYEMPVEYLKQLGVEIDLPDFAEPDLVYSDFIEPDYLEADYEKLETIEFYELKRGIIGVNKIGYVSVNS